MLDNHAYNLMSQIVTEHRSLYRIRDQYQKDAGDCDACNTFWKKMVDDKEEHIVELTALIKNHLG